MENRTELTSREESRGQSAAHQEALSRLLKEFDRVCKKLNIKYFLFAGTLLGAVRHHGFIPWDDDLDVIMPRGDYERFLSEADTVLDGEKFFLQKEFSENWPMFFSKLRLNKTTCLEAYHPKYPSCHQGIYMDIFPLDTAKKGKFGRKMQFWASKIVITRSLDRRGYETDSPLKKALMIVSRALPMKLFLKLAKSGDADSGILHSFFAAAKSMERNLYDEKLFSETIEGTFGDGVYPIPANYDAILCILYGDYMTLPPPKERVCKQHAILVDTERSYEEYEHYRDGMHFEVKTKSIR